ncbi:putative bifunctional diguanylate cyclase/phosphodiesterase [Roseomonas sp. CCTCC AB2023176]|uniref:putative bifunctional diguanylate cyclase/phosphodiesterase n=1 Tax=Roseomonas sp. CCTCC AB2023176 TaxID=3342640 RepID=UPI0035DFE586
MPPAPLPKDESRRLAELDELDLLDGPAEEVFAGHARAAAALLGTPAAAVSFVDRTRIVLRGAVGTPWTELPRAAAFCAHAILRPSEALVVPDATADPRFADNPLVTGPQGIRFFAGIPLVTEGGNALGTLHVVDRHPREPSPAHVERLRDLARGVVAALTLRRARRTLATAAMTDPLTGIGNRAALDAALAQAVPRRSMLLLDLDRFGAINDAFGHAGGDRALAEVAQRLRMATRPTDRVFRLSGDEFAVLASGIGDLDTADRLAARIHEVLARPFAINGSTVTLRTSIGYAATPWHGPDAAALLHRADAALAAAKRAGRGLTRAAERAQAAGSIGRAGIEARVHAAFAPGGVVPFHLVFQPILDLRGGRVCSVEALVRWRLEDGEVLTPGEFLPVIERLGYAGALDRWVTGEACRLMAEPGQRVSVAVNAGASTFCDPGFAPHVAACLETHALPGERLIVEMTESSLAGDDDAALGTVLALGRLGVGVALDDFGGGHGTLARARLYPFAKVKLDRVLVEGCGTDPRADALVQAVTGMAGALSMESVAEGVETPEQLRHVARAGVTRVQGYFLSRPVTWETLPAACSAAEGVLRNTLRPPTLAAARNAA